MGESRYTLADVRASNGSGGAPAWIIYKDSVYNVTSYLNQHPAGGDIILAEAGSDATIAFDDVGHSAGAKKILAKFKIGEIVEEEKVYDANGKKKKKVVQVKPDNGGGRSCLNMATCGLVG